jgi:hypothetical protein
LTETLTMFPFPLASWIFLISRFFSSEAMFPGNLEQWIELWYKLALLWLYIWYYYFPAQASCRCKGIGTVPTETQHPGKWQWPSSWAHSLLELEVSLLFEHHRYTIPGKLQIFTRLLTHWLPQLRENCQGCFTV